MTILVSAQSTRAPFSLTISAPSVVPVGSELRLNVTLTNTSNHSISLPRSNGDAQAELYTDVDVWSEQDGPAAETGYRRSLREDSVVRSDVLVTLEPGKSHTDQIVVTKLFELRPDAYKIQVRRNTHRWMAGAVVKSNVTSIVVKP